MAGGKFKRSTEQHSVSDETIAEECGTSASKLTADSQQVEESMTNLEVILQELIGFRQENGGTMREIKEENKTNNRIDEAEQRIVDAEERLQCNCRLTWRRG